MAAVLFPEIFKKAQAEIDRYVGSSRMPTFGDKHRLPYTDAFILELLRWRPPTPGGIPHAVIQDDIYDGYFIPKGSTVIANAWALTRDESTFPDPDNFDPERWINHPDHALSSLGFGFGRRSCPGHWVARNSIFIVVARYVTIPD